LLRDAVYYVRAFGTALNNYSLQVAGPSLQPPIAFSDLAVVVSDAPSVEIDILSNDIDADGNAAALVPELASTAPVSFQITSGRKVGFTAAAGTFGVSRTTYTVRDSDGFRSPAAAIEVFYVDYSRAAPWLNPQLQNDSNSDGKVTPIDALLVINYLNSTGNRNLPTSGSTNVFGFIDTNGNGRISPSDALLVINELNSRSGSSEGEAPVPSAHDLALQQIYIDDWSWDRPTKSNKRSR
jgi:hypothetical protein